MTYQLIHGDCLEILKNLDANSVDLLINDPPYYRVKGDYWDRQWDNPTSFLDWIGELCQQWRRVLRPNGSLYVFASPQMAARVEVKVGEYFNVLNNIRWQKPPFDTKAEMFRKEDLRCFFPASETIIFAEQWWSDDAAKGNIGEHFFQPIQEQLLAAKDGKSIDDLSSISGLPSSQVSHYFRRDANGWRLPDQTALNAMGLNLKEDELRQQYNLLRRDYENLRRPFQASEDTPYTDVWTFPTVQAYPGKHPCEKPLVMLEHIITVSSKPGAVVMDCFAGSFNTGIACLKTGRDFIGIEADDKYFRRGKRRMSHAEAEQTGQWKTLKDDGHGLVGLPMFFDASPEQVISNDH